MHARKTWALALLAAALLALAWLGPLDQWAGEQSHAGLKRALATFAAARALNGAISVAQGTEIAVEPAGVGVTFTPGQVLDPVNDLVEQFSTLMLTASVSFAVQGTLVAVGGHWLASLLLSAALLAWLAWRIWWPQGAALPWLQRALLLCLLLRFAVPLAALGSDLCFRAFLAERYQASQQALALGEREVSGLAQPPAEAPPASMGEQVRRWWRDAGEAIDVEARLAALRETAARVTEHVVELIVVFLLQTLIVPTLLLWGLWRAALGLLAPRT